MFGLIKCHKLISGLVCVNIIAIIVIIITIVVYQAKTAVVDIYVAPSNAKISLNGKEYANFESHDVVPGNYHVKISMDGMQTKEYDITLENEGFVRIRTYLLDANNGFDYYFTHPNDEAILADIVEENDKAALKFIKVFNEKKSLEEHLPIYYDAFTDDFAYYIKYNISQENRDDCSRVLCLKIEDNTGNNKENAIAKIRELGYNPDDYEINYQYVPLSTAEMNNE